MLKTAILCLTMLTISQLGHAQYFADVKYQSRHKEKRYMVDEASEPRSAVDKLDSSSTWFDFITA